MISDRLNAWIKECSVQLTDYQMARLQQTLKEEVDEIKKELEDLNNQVIELLEIIK